jgi:hypothetical protein
MGFEAHLDFEKRRVEMGTHPEGLRLPRRLISLLVLAIGSATTALPAIAADTSTAGKTAVDQSAGLQSLGLNEQAKAVVNAQIDQAKVAATDATQKNDATKKFLGMNWGFGVALTSNLGGKDRVTSATLVNNVVRVQQTTNQQPRIVLELHHFFCTGLDTCPGATTEGSMAPKPQFGHGPWVGVQSSSDQVIDAIAFGYMVGWRPSEKDSPSFNLGLGVVVDAKVQVLGDGVQANQPLPAGVTSVPLKNESRTGGILMVAFSF